MYKSVSIFACLIFLFGWKAGAQKFQIAVSNHLDFERNEIIEIPISKLSKVLKNNPEKNIRIRNKNSTDYLFLQWIDYNSDGKNDALLFQADVKANSVSNYNIVADANLPETKSQTGTFARFVPERSDDFAWENDKVAFRTYGPKGQKEALAGVPGSTLSSGIDLWFKKVSYPIIDKWYGGHIKSPGYYHADHGEGYDPYHVGDSRGTGGIGIFVNDSLLVSQNFTGYKVIATGPLRTVFELTYAPWSRFGVTETKRISLDLGSNFSKFEIGLSSKIPVPNYTIGLTLHDHKGETKMTESQGRFRYWEAIDGIFVGEGIAIDPKIIDSAAVKKSNIPDQSSILVFVNPKQKLIYYAGFAWQKSGQVSTVSDWDLLLEKQSKIISNPMEVSITTKNK